MSHLDKNALNKNNLIKKLIYKSNYMGCKENDIIFGHFAKDNLQNMSSSELALYEELLTCDDGKLLSWITESDEPHEKFKNLINKILKYTEQKHVRPQ